MLFLELQEVQMDWTQAAALRYRRRKSPKVHTSQEGKVISRSIYWQVLPAPSNDGNVPTTR